MELIGSEAQGGDSLQVWISKGDGTFTAGQRSSGAQIIGGFGTFAGDFDGDGRADIATIYADKGPVTVQVWYGAMAPGISGRHSRLQIPITMTA